MSNTHLTYTKENEEACVKASDRYRDEMEFIARYFDCDYQRNRKWFPLMMMTYTTAAWLLRLYGASEYRRGYNDGVQQKDEP